MGCSREAGDQGNRKGRKLKGKKCESERERDRCERVS